VAQGVGPEFKPHYCKKKFLNHKKRAGGVVRKGRKRNSKL
jgi:hypothetical protein